jgi:hypothetical protein
LIKARFQIDFPICRKIPEWFFETGSKPVIFSPRILFFENTRTSSVTMKMFAEPGGVIIFLRKKMELMKFYFTSATFYFFGFPDSSELESLGSSELPRLPSLPLRSESLSDWSSPCTSSRVSSYREQMRSSL